MSAPTSLVFAALATLGLTGACRPLPPPVGARLVPTRVGPGIEGEPVEARAIPGDPVAAVPLDDGAWARMERDNHLRLVNAEGESLSELDLPGTDGCLLQAWSTRAFVRCNTPAERRNEAIFAAPTPRLARMGAEARDLFASRDGRTLTRNGACRAGAVDLPTERDEVSACTLAPDRPWRTWTAPGEGRVLDVFDGQALIALRQSMVIPGRPRAVTWEVRRYDIDHGSWLPLIVGEPTARWMRAGFARDGRVVGLVQMGSGGRAEGFYVLGDPDRGALRMMSLPRAADDVGTLEDERALFVAGSEAFVTTDGVHFRGVSGLTPRNSPAPQADDGGPQRIGARITCAGDLCSVDGTSALRVPRLVRDP